MDGLQILRVYEDDQQQIPSQALPSLHFQFKNFKFHYTHQIPEETPGSSFEPTGIQTHQIVLILKIMNFLFISFVSLIPILLDPAILWIGIFNKIANK